MLEPLSAESIAGHSAARWIGSRIECLDVVDSTNLRLRDLAWSGAVDGTVVTAEEQTQGRGRLGRNWMSPRGRNLTMSVLLRTDLAPECIPQIALTAGLAACETVEEHCPAVLKWPNDVLVAGRKVVGILAELESRVDERFVVLGVGINVNMEAKEIPAELADKAGSLAIATGKMVPRARVAGRFLAHLERRYDELRRHGFAALATAWMQRSGFVGQRIRVQEAGGIVEGEVLGLAPDGALRLGRDDGSEQRIVAGDVSVVDGYAGAADFRPGRVL